MGKGIAEQLQKEYSLEVQWIGYELHPETPKGGSLIKDAFPDLNVKKMINNLNEIGQPFGIIFNKMEIISNTRLALEASEFAREQGKHEVFHNSVFKAYFEAGDDIGKLDTVLSCANDVGLDVDKLEQALLRQEYAEVIAKSRELGLQQNVVGLPTFIFNNEKRIVGAKSYDTFVQILKQISK